MAFLLGCEKVSLEYPTKRVFADLSLGVSTGDRIGIVGRNGDGKSTLLGLLSGEVAPDEGRVIRTRGVSVGFLGQSDALDDAASVCTAVVGDRPVYEWASDSRIRSIIDGLLADIGWESPVGELSGGQRRRVDLARLLVGDWDVLLLDEPTNHLDMRAITWLADHLKTRWRQLGGALLVVTHDRWFLDEVCTQMWEVHDCSVQPFEGGFSAYILQRVERDRQAAVAEQKRQNMLRRELAWLSRGARARATKPKFHVAAAEALIADVPQLRNPIELKRMAMARLGKLVVEMDRACERFGQHTVLRDISWIIGPGDRFGIIGENGAGKTTLLRLISGELKPSSGTVKIGASVRFAVLSQHLDELNAWGAEPVRKVIGRYSRRVMLDGKEQTPAQLLSLLGFSEADLNEPVCDLSGGQKRRLALMMILLDEPNVLILDEPGNDLDVDMLAAVESLLDGWPGTLVLVTHDRYLMERVTDHQFGLMDGKIVHLPGGVDEYLALVNGVPQGIGAAAGSENAVRGRAKGAKCAGFAGAVRDAAGGAAGGASGASVHAPQAGQTLSGGEQHRLRKMMDSNERKIETLRGKIDDARVRMSEADQSDYMALTQLQDEIQAYQEQIETLEAAWFEAAEKLGD